MEEMKDKVNETEVLNLINNRDVSRMSYNDIKIVIDWYESVRHNCHYCVHSECTDFNLHCMYCSQFNNFLLKPLCECFVDGN